MLPLLQGFYGLGYYEMHFWLCYYKSFASYSCFNTYIIITYRCSQNLKALFMFPISVAQLARLAEHLTFIFKINDMLLKQKSCFLSIYSSVHAYFCQSKYI